MLEITSRLAATSVLVSSITLFGCSSSGDGVTVPTVPANAITITSANAEQVTSDAISGGDTALSAPFAIETTQTPSAKDIIDLVRDKVKNMDGSSVLSTPTGITEVFPCFSGGTVTLDVDATFTSGTITYSNCAEFGATFNGAFNFSETFDPAGNFTFTLSGNITVDDGTVITTISGLSLNETGNFSSGDFSLNTYTFAVDFTGGNGFAVQLLAPIVGNDFDVCPNTPASGIVLVTGANGTQAKATINTDSSVTLEFNDGTGTFTEVTGSPFACTTFFSAF